MNNFANPASHLRQEYAYQKALFESQPVMLQRFLESQAQLLAEALIMKASQVRFLLPDKVLTHIPQINQDSIITIPENEREYRFGTLRNRVLRHEVREALLQCLRMLEQSPDEGIAAAASLLRYATAVHLVYKRLPAGRSVTYRPDEDEIIPSIPVDDHAPQSAITQRDDAITEEYDTEAGRGELQSPFVPDARRFYLPQWVAFGENNTLLVASEKEAEAHILSMQKYVQILHRASSLAPYIVACDAYQRRRYGILGQLINQGRALANFKTMMIIQEIKTRVAEGRLNRGLSISMPYFDDQNLEMNELRFEVIPSGRIMFSPLFLVRTTHNEQAKVSQDTRLNASTRKHLLEQLKMLETAFRA